MPEDIKMQFDELVKKVREGAVNKQPTQTQKLQLYAWYKQATEGDAHNDIPNGFDIVAKAKYAAWLRVKGMAPEEAMRQYLQFFSV